MTGDGPEFLGLGGRLEAAAGEDLVAAGFALEMADAKLLHDGFGLADLAHVLALADAGVLPEDDAGVLVDALLEMAAVPSGEFPYDAAYGDPWNSRERWLEARAGARAGWLTVGRPRREAAAGRGILSRARGDSSRTPTTRTAPPPPRIDARAGN